MWESCWGRHSCSLLTPVSLQAELRSCLGAAVDHQGLATLPQCLLLVSRVWKPIFEAESFSPHSSWMRTRPGCCGRRRPDLFPDLPTRGLRGGDEALAPAPGVGLQPKEPRREPSYWLNPQGWDLFCHPWTHERWPICCGPFGCISDCGMQLEGRGFGELGQ